MRVKLYLRGTIWWTWYTDHRGKRTYTSTHQRDRALARAAAQRLAREAIEPPAPEVRLSDVLARFMDSVERRGRAPATVGYYELRARALLAGLGADRDVNALTLADVEAYCDRRSVDVSRATIAKELGTLASALRHAKRHGLYAGDPARLRPDGLEAAYVPRERALSHAEFGQLLAALPPARRDYLLVFCATGVRDSELYRLEARDLEGDKLHVRGRKTGRADRWIPMTPEAREVLTRRAQLAQDACLFSPWGNQRRDLRAACARAGIAPVSPNDLRRTFASWLAEAGVPELVTAALLGHASSAMVRRVYARIGIDARTVAIRSLPPLAIAADGVVDTAKNQANRGTQETTRRRRKH